MKKKIDSTKRIKGILVTICLFFISLTGCGTPRITENTIAIADNGEIVQTILEEFPTDTYDIDELKEMNEKEVKEYNDKAGKESIIIKKTEMTDSRVMVVMEYENASDYYGYNREPFYTGTLEQAKKAGYDMSVELKSIKDDSVLSKEELSEMGDKHIVILSEEQNVITPGNILYISDGVTYKDKKLATVSGGNPSYIVFK